MEKIEKAKNSQLAREVEIALPVELNREQQIQLVREYVKDNFVLVGMCADIAIHDKEDGNPHAHIMLTMRQLEESGEWGAKSKKEYILDKDGQREKLKNGTFKSRKINTVDWNEKEKAEVWIDDKTGEGTSIYQSYPIEAKSVSHSVGIFKQNHSGK